MKVFLQTFIGYLWIGGPFLALGLLLVVFSVSTPFRRFRRSVTKTFNIEIERAEGLRKTYGAYSRLVRTREGRQAMLNVIRYVKKEVPVKEFYDFFDDVFPQVQPLIHTPSELESYGKVTVALYRVFKTTDQRARTIILDHTLQKILSEVRSPDDLLNEELLARGLRLALRDDYSAWSSSPAEYYDGYASGGYSGVDVDGEIQSILANLSIRLAMSAANLRAMRAHPDHQPDVDPRAAQAA
jgi:hypothetical protein